MPIDTSPATLPWYKSKVIIGALVAIFATLAQRFGIASLAPDDQADLIDLILTLVGAAGGGTALIARVTQRYAPAIRP